MKRATNILLLLALTILFGCSGKSDSEKSGGESKPAEASSSSMPNRYEIKSGIVYYEPVEIMGVKTVETMYFDDYGKREAKETVTESNIMGMKTREHKMDITDGDYAISYEVEKIINGKDETSKEATKTNLKDFKEMAMMMGKALDPEEMKRNFDYREEGTEQIAGVTGTRYSVALNKEQPDARAYGVIYKNIVLKSEMANIAIKASRIEENVSVPSEKFEVPAGYTVKEVDVNKMMAGEDEEDEQK